MAAPDPATSSSLHVGRAHELRRRGLKYLLLVLLLLLEEAEPEDVVERGAGGGLQELAWGLDRPDARPPAAAPPCRRSYQPGCYGRTSLATIGCARCGTTPGHAWQGRRP
jgi:hypothetical protein